MAEELDVVGRRKDEVAFAACQLASAVLACPVASEQARELARVVLADGVAMRHDEPREAASIAATFNRQMDAAIESCNGSARRATRMARRADLARDLDLAGLVLVDRAVMAELLIPRVEFTPLYGEAFRSFEDPAGKWILGAAGELHNYNQGFVPGFMEGATGEPALNPGVND